MRPLARGLSILANCEMRLQQTTTAVLNNIVINRVLVSRRELGGHAFRTHAAQCKVGVGVQVY